MRACTITAIYKREEKNADNHNKFVWPRTIWTARRGGGVDEERERERVSRRARRETSRRGAPYYIIILYACIFYDDDSGDGCTAGDKRPPRRRSRRIREKQYYFIRKPAVVHRAAFIIGVYRARAHAAAVSCLNARVPQVTGRSRIPQIFTARVMPATPRDAPANTPAAQAHIYVYNSTKVFSGA